MGRAVVLTADDFLLAPDEVRQSSMRAWAAKRGHHFGKDTQVPLEAVLTGKEVVRLQKHKEAFATRSSVSGCYCTDLEQNVGWCGASPYTPCLVRHAKLVSINKEKMYVPQEHLAIMGEPIYMDPSKTDYAPCFFQGLIDNGRISPNQQKQLAGNAMHIPSMGSWMLYCFSRMDIL